VLGVRIRTGQTALFCMEIPTRHPGRASGSSEPNDGGGVLGGSGEGECACPSCWQGNLATSLPPGPAQSLLLLGRLRSSRDQAVAYWRPTSRSRVAIGPHRS
jgi:hypothetical protein